MTNPPPTHWLNFRSAGNCFLVKSYATDSRFLISDDAAETSQSPNTLLVGLSHICPSCFSDYRAQHCHFKKRTVTNLPPTNWWSLTAKLTFLDAPTANSFAAFECLLVGWLFGCLTSQQLATVYHGRIRSDTFTSCHTEIEVADQTISTSHSILSPGPPAPALTP